MADTLVCSKCKVAVEIAGSPIVAWNKELKGWPEGWTCVKFIRREVFISQAKPSLGKPGISNNSNTYAVCPKCMPVVLEDMLNVIR